MNRKELYKKVVELNLQEEVKKVCGRNYTQASNSVLEEVVNKAEIAKNMAAVAATTFNSPSSDTTKVNIADKFEKLIKILSHKRILLGSEVKSIMD